MSCTLANGLGYACGYVCTQDNFDSICWLYCLQEDKYTALHLAVEQEDLTSLHMVEFISTNR